MQADGNPQSLELFTYVNDDAVASENNPAEKYYAFTAINAVWDPVYDPDPTLSFTATTNKTIDYLGDGVVNNDTDLSGSNAYRIYLDAQSMTAGGVDLLIVEDSTTSMSTRYGDSTRIMTLDALINGTPSGDGSRSGDGFIYNFLRQNPQNKVAVVKFAGSNDRENHAYEDEKDYVAKITFPWQSATEIANKNGALTPDACTADVLEMKPGTNYETAFLRMDEMLKQVAGDGNAKVVVFISDGEPNAIVNESGIIIQKKDFNHLESSL